MPEPIQKKVCMIGSYGVGKTSLVRRFVESIFDERYQTTIGVKIDRKRVVVDETELNLILWDLAGEDELAQIRDSHVRGASGFILVADGCRAATLERAVSLRQLLGKPVAGIPFVLAINKADRAADWEIPASSLEELARTGWRLLSTSAKTGDGVESLFETLARSMLTSMQDRAVDGI